MSVEQRWKVEAFAAQLKTAKARVDLVYAGNGHWSASSSGPAGEVSLTTPGGDSWPRLERLMRVLAAVGIVQARVIFRGLTPVFASRSATIETSAGSGGGLEQYAKVAAFSEKARSSNAEVELDFGSDGLWYVYASSPDGRHALTPICGDGWGRLDGLLQMLAGAGLSEARATFDGMPPASVMVGNA